MKPRYKYVAYERLGQRRRLWDEPYKWMTFVGDRIIEEWSHPSGIMFAEPLSMPDAEKARLRAIR